MKSNKKQKQSESTPVRKTSEKLDVEDTSSSLAHKESSHTNGNRSSYKIIGEAATQVCSKFLSFSACHIHTISVWLNHLKIIDLQKNLKTKIW